MQLVGEEDAGSVIVPFAGDAGSVIVPVELGGGELGRVTVTV